MTKEIHGVDILILSFDDWIDHQINEYEIENADEFMSKWIFTIAECICQLKRDVAPIDEPTYEWVDELKNLLVNELAKK